MSRGYSIAIFVTSAYLLATGCGGPSLGPQLEYRDIRLDEQTAPLPFVIALHNSGYEAADIENVSVQVLQKTLISRPQDELPTGFDHSVEFSEDHPTRVEAGGEGVACGFLRWDLPPDPPPMLAVVRCVFVVEYDDGQLETEPITLLLQSREGVLLGEQPEALVARDQAAGILQALSTIPGRKSDGFSKLIEQMEAVAAGGESVP
jgi:hypothetical protein